MAVSLSRSAVARAQRASQAILSAATEQEPVAFRLSAARAVRELLDADRALCFLPVPGVNPFASEDFSAEWLEDFAAYFRVIDEGARRARAFGLNVWTQALLVRGETEAYHRSEQYQRWLAPNRLHDTAGVTVYSDADLAYPDAFVVGYRESETPPYSDRVVALLTLVWPAFRAGVHVQRALAQQLSAMQRLLDDLPHGVAVVDHRGRSIHRTPKLTAMLSVDPQSAGLEDAMHRATCAALARRARREREASLPGADDLSVVVRTDRARYRVSACTADNIHHTVAAVVVVEPLGERSLSPTELRDRFGLTPREIEVARLLALGRRNTDIARELGVTDHTAERHTEHVLAKLGIHSRAAVGAKLREQ